jgi:hypothetical protein
LEVDLTRGDVVTVLPVTPTTPTLSYKSTRLPLKATSDPEDPPHELCNGISGDRTRFMDDHDNFGAKALGIPAMNWSVVIDNLKEFTIPAFYAKEQRETSPDTEIRRSSGCRLED